MSAKSEQRSSTEHIVSQVGLTLSRAATVEAARNELRNSGLWSVDRPGAIQLERTTGEATENFSLGSAHAAK